MLLKLAQSGKLQPSQLITHRMFYNHLEIETRRLT